MKWSTFKWVAVGGGTPLEFSMWAPAWRWTPSWLQTCELVDILHRLRLTISYPYLVNTYLIIVISLAHFGSIPHGSACQFGDRAILRPVISSPSRLPATQLFTRSLPNKSELSYPITTQCYVPSHPVIYALFQIIPNLLSRHPLVSA